MAFGDIVQSNHSIVTASTASVALQLSNPTEHGNSIIILATRGFSGLMGTADALVASHANWVFTERSTDGLGAYPAESRLIDALGAMVGFGPVVLTQSDGGSFPAGAIFSIYEIETPNGCTFQTVSLNAYGEGYSAVYPFNHTRLVEHGRKAFILYARQFSSNSGFTEAQLWDPLYSNILALPQVYTFTTTNPTTARRYQVFHDKLDMAVPMPVEAHTWFGVAGAGVEAGAVLGQYVDGTDVQTTISKAAVYGSGGSYAPRADAARTSAWTAGGSLTQALTKPTGTTSGDAVFLVHLFEGDPGTFTWPTGFVELDADGFDEIHTQVAWDGHGIDEEFGSTTNDGSTVDHVFHWRIAVKAAGASEPSSYTTTRGNNTYAGRGFCFTIIGMPAASQVLVSETGGVNRYPEGTTFTGSPQVAEGDTYSGWGLWCGGARDDAQNRRFARQRAKSTDYIVLLISDVGFDLTWNHTVAPTPDLSFTPANDGYHLRVWGSCTDYYARVTVQDYMTTTNPADLMIPEYTFAKAFVIGIPAVIESDDQGEKVQPLTASVKQLPYDLRDIRLPGELT